MTQHAVELPEGREARASPDKGNGPVAARPQLMRAMNERLLLEHVHSAGPISRPDLARRSGLSKPTVATAVANLERGGLVQVGGRRTGVRGPAAALYEIRPEAGYVLGLDVGRKYLRGALADLIGSVHARRSRPVRVATAHRRIADLAALAGELAADAGIALSDVTQTVIGSPGVYDSRRGALTMARNLPGWEHPGVLADLKEVFGDATAVENDVDLAALAERDKGYGRDVDTFCFVSVGTGIGMGLVIDGQLHRGAHGVAGEIAFLPVAAAGVSARDARGHGQLETLASAAAVVNAARRLGLSGPLSARRVFAAAAEGDPRAVNVVRREALLVATAISSVIAVVDPELVVLGGGIGQAPGFAEAVVAELKGLAPVVPELRVSALGADSVVLGSVASGLDRAWQGVLRRV